MKSLTETDRYNEGGEHFTLLKQKRYLYSMASVIIIGLFAWLLFYRMWKNRIISFPVETTGASLTGTFMVLAFGTVWVFALIFSKVLEKRIWGEQKRRRTKRNLSRNVILGLLCIAIHNFLLNAVVNERSIGHPDSRAAVRLSIEASVMQWALPAICTAEIVWEIASCIRAYKNDSDV
ncbi:MAG: hypothetical protein VB096_08960 [Pseudoflavonifractor sp.]|nr:hypothetical protein [Pseudoflavonifractor sp.]